MTRKEFLAKFGFGAGVVILAPMALSSCEESDDPSTDSSDDTDDGGDDSSNGVDFTIDLNSGAYSDLQQIGGYVYENDILIAFLGGTEYIALSKICTHQACTVQYSQAQGQVICPCHGSVFSTDGSVIEGPAGAPLQEYNTELDGDTLRIFE